MNELERLEYITDKLESQGYHGIDADLTISLGEYSIIIKPVDSGQDRTYKAIYQTHYSGVRYFCAQCFQGRWIGDLINDYGNNEFLDFIGVDLETWSRSPVVMILADLMNYYGHLNIFGDPYNSRTLDELYHEVVS